MSVLSVTSLRLSRRRSAWARIFSLSFSPPRATAPGISPGLASIASTEPKWRMSAPAVTSPTPGTPGTGSGPVVIVNRSGGIHQTVAGPAQGGDPTR